MQIEPVRRSQKSRKPEKLSLKEARSWVLARQGLLVKDTFGRGKEGSLEALELLGYVQIDSISVVERAHHHILWSRVRDHSPTTLAQLTADKTAFEYWSHAASYLPMRDFRYSLPRKRRYASGEHHWFKPGDEHRKWRRKILAQIRERGPQSIRDFATPQEKRIGSWFEWKPAKQMIEQLFMEGALMVTGRKGIEKFFDLTERVLPADVDTSFPSPAEMARHLIFSHLRANGFGRPETIAYQRRLVAETVVKECAKLLKEGVLREIAIEGSEKPWLTTSEPTGGVHRGVHILSPFDNLVIQRKRMQELFGYSYTIECYTPKHKRKVGYFGLPVLMDGSIIGQVDLKADRKSGVLLVQGEDLPSLSERQRAALSRELQAFARFNGCESVERRVLRH